MYIMLRNICLITILCGTPYNCINTSSTTPDLSPHYHTFPLNVTTDVHELCFDLLVVIVYHVSTYICLITISCGTPYNCINTSATTPDLSPHYHTFPLNVTTDVHELCFDLLVVIVYHVSTYICLITISCGTPYNCINTSATTPDLSPHYHTFPLNVLTY